MIDKINTCFSALPNEIVLNVFSFLNLDTLGRICSVSTKWKQLASDEKLWKKREVYENAITNKKWAQWFGEEVVAGEDFNEEWESLPWNISWILQSRCPIFPGKKIKETHRLVRLPKTLNGGLTLKTLGELAKKYFPNNPKGYIDIWPSIIDELGDKSIEKSCWVMIPEDVLPKSRCKSYAEQQKMVNELAEKSLISYEVPETLESAACILSQYFDSNIRLFSDNPWTYTRCKDKVKDFQINVGGLASAVASDGLSVFLSHYNDDNIGVAVLRKF